MSMRAFARVAIVLLFVALDLGFVLPDLSRTVTQIGSTGITTRFLVPNIVAYVDPNSPAANAHIQVGDIITLSTPADRGRWLFSASDIVRHSGVTQVLTLTHHGQKRVVTLVATEDDSYPVWMTVVRVFVETFSVVLAAFLLLRRPNVTTWAFFFFSIFPTIASFAVATMTYPPVVLAIYYIVVVGLSGPGTAAGIVFVLSLGAQPVPRWHWIAGYVLVPVVVLITLPTSAFILLWIFAGVTQSAFAFGADPTYFTIVGTLTTLMTLALLIPIYQENRGRTRQQLTWIAAGLVISSAAGIAPPLFPPSTPFAFVAACFILKGALPLCVAYAVLKHRLIDINFFVSRTLVYGTISGGVIALFGFIDWLFAKELDNQKVGVFAEVAAAIAVGFWFSSIHRRVDQFIDSVFYRRKHLAEKHLQHLAKALHHAPSEASITNGLVDDPVTALELSSAALFKRNGMPSFRRVHARGWDAGTVDDLQADDTLLLRMQLDRETLVLDDVAIGNRGFPRGPARPDIALPIHIRNDLVAVVFYGGHAHGEHLDADEIHAISALGSGASAGYASIQAQALVAKAEAAELRAEIAQREAGQLRSEVEALLRASRGPADPA
jgi:hypothetical protein